MLTDTATSAPKRRKYMTASKVRQILQQQEASGTSLYQYCRDHELPYKTITNWRSKQNKVRVERRPQVAFVPVEVKLDTAPVVSVDAANVALAPTMEIRLRHQRAICVRADFDVVALQRLVAALEGLPC
jgi:hypothetical protein